MHSPSIRACPCSSTVPDVHACEPFERYAARWIESVGGVDESEMPDRRELVMLARCLASPACFRFCKMQMIEDQPVALRARESTALVQASGASTIRRK